MFDYVINCRRKFIHTSARHDDGVTAAVRFLSDAQEFPTVIFAEFDVEVLTLDLHVPRFDEIIHGCKKPRSLGRSVSKREAVFLRKTRAGNAFIGNRFRDGLTPSRAFFRALIGNGEVDLTFKRIDSRHEYTDFIADFEAAVRPASDQTALGRVEAIKIVAQR